MNKVNLKYLDIIETYLKSEDVIGFLYFINELRKVAIREYPNSKGHTYNCDIHYDYLDVDKEGILATTWVGDNDFISLLAILQNTFPNSLNKKGDILYNYIDKAYRKRFIRYLGENSCELIYAIRGKVLKAKQSKQFSRLSIENKKLLTDYCNLLNCYFNIIKKYINTNTRKYGILFSPHTGINPGRILFLDSQVTRQHFYKQNHYYQKLKRILHECNVEIIAEER